MKKLANVKDFGRIIHAFNDFRFTKSSQFGNKYGHDYSKFERFELEFRNKSFSITACDGFFLVKGAFSAEIFEEKSFDISVKEKLTKSLCINDLSDEIYFEESKPNASSIKGNLISGKRVFVAYDTGKSFTDFPFRKNENFTVNNFFDSLVKVFNKDYLEALNYRKNMDNEELTFEDNNFYITVNKNGLVLKDLSRDKTLQASIKNSENIEEEINFYLNKWMLYRVLKLFSTYKIDDITFFLDNKTDNNFIRVDVCIEGKNLLGIIAGAVKCK